MKKTDLVVQLGKVGTENLVKELQNGDNSKDIGYSITVSLYNGSLQGSIDGVLIYIGFHVSIS